MLEVRACKMVTEKTIDPKLIRGKVVRMAKNTIPIRGGKNRMLPVPATQAASEVPDHEYPPQVKKKGGKQSP
jgi:hypothetical protein